MTETLIPEQILAGSTELTFHSVISIRAVHPEPATDFIVTINYTFGNEPDFIVAPYGLTPNATGKTADAIRQWLVDHEGEYEVIPYVEKVLTDEEKRAEMPALTSRQFWMAAAHIGADGLDKDAIITVIKAQIPDSVDRKMMIAELEASTFERLNPTILDVMELLEIPAEQIDALWMWAASL